MEEDLLDLASFSGSDSEFASASASALPPPLLAAFAFFLASLRFAFLLPDLVTSPLGALSVSTRAAPGTPPAPRVFHASAVLFLYTSTSSGGL